jgi:HEAT repeat protein
VPGPESFAKEPKTPLELWDAVDYLVRVGQADKAAPYLDAFMKSKPSDDVLLDIRDKFGAGSILRLQDDPATRAQVEPLMKLVRDASLRHSRNPERIQKYIAALTKSRAEQDYAVARLREAGPYAVPALLDTIGNPGLPPSDRDLIVQNMGRLERPAVPALIAAIDGPDALVAASAIDALGRIGDIRAIPFLLYPAAKPEDSPLREPSRIALNRITGRPFASLPKSALRLLVDEARRYLTHAVPFPGDKVVLWVWEGNAPVPKEATIGEAEGILGMRFAREALDLDPTDLEAQATQLGLVLQKAIERVGLAAFPSQDPTGAYPLALASGPTVLGEVVRRALADGLSDLAAASIFVLGRVADRDALVTDRRVNPLIEALSAPDRRARFAAAQALVYLNPQQPFPGSSRVVPVLTQFVASQPQPRVVIIDGAEARGNTVASTLKALGYEPSTAVSGDQGFRIAAESADVEAIFIEPTILQGNWRTRDTLANLRADAATAGVPIFIYGELRLQDLLSAELTSYPRVAFVVTPTDPNLFKPILERELRRMGARPLVAAERDGLAQAAASLLAEITSRPGSPLLANVSAAEPALAVALNHASASLPAAAALGDVPGVEAQRSLADTALDAANPPQLRLGAVDNLARSIQRFGPLVSADHERRIAAELDSEADPTLRAAFASVVGALRPKPTPVGVRLRTFKPAPPTGSSPAATPPAAPIPADAAPKPEAVPKPDEAAPPGDAAPAPKPDKPDDAVPAPGGEEKPKS